MLGSARMHVGIPPWFPVPHLSILLFFQEEDEEQLPISGLRSGGDIEIAAAFPRNGHIL